jgi:hypothetical protein
MTQAAKKLLEEFDALQEADRAEVLAELLRRVALAPHDLPNCDDLAATADQVFVELDRRENRAMDGECCARPDSGGSNRGSTLTE